MDKEYIKAQVQQAIKEQISPVTEDMIEGSLRSKGRLLWNAFLLNLAVGIPGGIGAGLLSAGIAFGSGPIVLIPAGIMYAAAISAGIAIGGKATVTYRYGKKMDKLYKRLVDNVNARDDILKQAANADENSYPKLQSKFESLTAEQIKIAEELKKYVDLSAKDDPDYVRAMNRLSLKEKHDVATFIVAAQEGRLSFDESIKKAIKPGTIDTTVPAQQTAKFWDTLRRAGVSV